MYQGTMGHCSANAHVRDASGDADMIQKMLLPSLQCMVYGKNCIQSYVHLRLPALKGHCSMSSAALLRGCRGVEEGALRGA